MKYHPFVSKPKNPSPLRSLCFVGLLLTAFANTCLADPENTTQVKVSLSFAKEDLSMEKKREYDFVSLKDASLPEDQPGTPWLPAKFVNVRVPDGAKVISVTVNPVKETLIAKGLNVYPVQPSVRGNQPAPEFVKPHAAAYKSNKKKELGKSGDAQQMREYTFVPVRINPVRLIAATGELYLAETVEITVEYKAQPQAAQAAPAKAGKRKDKADPFEKMMRNMVVNPDVSFKTTDGEAQAPASSKPIPSVEPQAAATPVETLPPGLCEYLIITSSDLAASFQALADYRAAFNGVTTHIVTTTTIYANYVGSDNQQKVRACIKDYVDNHGTLYVVLGGDGTKVPGRLMTVNGRWVLSDLYYAGLDTNWNNLDGDGHYGENLSTGTEGDLLADVFVGRIPMQSTKQVDNYTRKLIQYEKTPPVGIEKKLMINGAIADSIYSGTNRPSDLMNDGHLAFRDANHPSVSDAEMWMRRLYRDCIQVYGWQPSQFGVLMDSLTSWDGTTGGDYPASAPNMVTRFNEGWNFVFNSTHGVPDCLSADNSTDFDNSNHAAILTGLTTIFYTDACLSAKWDVGGSLGPAMLASPYGGALAYLGHAREASYSSDPPPASNTSTGGIADAYPRAFAKAVFGDRMPYMGEAFVAHQLKMNAQASVINTDNWNLDSMYGISLLGDPLLPVRTEATQPLLATHPEFVNFNQPFVVHVTRNGSPLNGSTVRIWNASERYEAMTDANGDATFTLSTVSIVGMRVMANAPNSIPYHGELNVQLDANPLVIVKATDAAASETGSNPGTWTFYRSDNIASPLTVYFSLGGNATPGSDYALPNYSSLTFPAGAASAVLTLTPVDDSVVGELTETAILTILSNSAYSIDELPALIAIADNDSMPPVVTAGPDQSGLYLRTFKWTPTEVLTAAWYDAADLTSINQYAGQVGTLKDKSGNGKDATQTWGTPTSGGSINGVHALNFDGATNALWIPAVGFSGSGYLVYVAQPVNDSSFAVVGAQDHYDRYTDAGTYARLFRTTRLGVASAGFPTNAAFMGAYEANSAAPFYNIYNNGTRKVNSTAAFTFSDNLTSINVQSSMAMAGQIGEIIALKYVPSTENRQKIEGYLAHKWGLAASLPAGHSYLNAAPMVDRVSVQLNGTTSDLENDVLVKTWSKVSGPGTVVFASPSAASTQASFSAEGVYTLRLSVSDGTTQTTDDVVINVRVNKLPTVNAGPDKTVISLTPDLWSPKNNYGVTTAAWFDAADLTTLTETSGLISQWRDKSGRGKHANQGTAASRPAPLGSINGVHALTFDGNSDTMSVPTMGSSGSAYITYVAQPVNDTGYSAMGCGDQWDVYNSANAYPKLFRSARFGPVGAGFPLNGAFMGAYEANSATPIYNVYNNGTRKVTSSGAFTFSDNWTGINSTGGRMTGQIGEVLALNYMPSTEIRQKIEGYLAHKWGLVAGLPADHPYKLAAPGPPARATLSGVTSDADGVPLPLTRYWTLVSGPQPVVFTNRTAPITEVLFTAPGAYKFRLTADDSLDQSIDECLITIKPMMDEDTDDMDDSWETTYFGSTGISNGTVDSDNDGFTDQQEYRCGTNPNNSNSLLKIASSNTINKTEMMLTFNAVEGKTYKLLASPNLTASSWQTIRTGIIGTSPSTSVSIPIEGSTMFFMIGVE
ncbi:MAG: C25 family cysteine peptidase [Verrucomicrobiota bacterium]